MWYRAVYYNEFMFALPGVLWSSLRRTGPQKILDVARTAVPAYLVMSYAIEGSLTHRQVVYGIVATIVLNLAMCSADARHVIKFNTGLYLASHVSVVAWLFGIGLGASTARACVCAVNFLAIATFLITLLVAVPYTQAWMCYPSNDPRMFTKGYCPQYTGDYAFSKACSFDNEASVSAVTARCNPHNFGEYTPVHDAIALEGHVAGHALIVSAVLYYTQIISRLPLARLAYCQEVAAKSK
jgi:hypothetical protein